jgi:hypothetical protein
MSRSPAQRAAEYRIRRACGLDAVLVDIDRDGVLAAGLMSASDYANSVERRRIRCWSVPKALLISGVDTRKTATASAARNRPRAAGVF